MGLWLVATLVLDNLDICSLRDLVVLLDEADVFLEQRTLQDLQRNALVSGREYGPKPLLCTSLTRIVFLRVLEYYDGTIFPPTRGTI